MRWVFFASLTLIVIGIYFLFALHYQYEKYTNKDEFIPHRFNVYRYSIVEREHLFKNIFPAGTEESYVDFVLLEAGIKAHVKGAPIIRNNCRVVEYVPPKPFWHTNIGGTWSRFYYSSSGKLSDMNINGRSFIISGKPVLSRINCEQSS
ncbi:MAG: hypothetical protein AAFW83_14420 [Pseudomonadota bacterium]